MKLVAFNPNFLCLYLLFGAIMHNKSMMSVLKNLKYFFKPRFLAFNFFELLRRISREPFDQFV